MLHLYRGCKAFCFPVSTLFACSIFEQPGTLVRTVINEYNTDQCWCADTVSLALWAIFSLVLLTRQRVSHRWWGWINNSRCNEVSRWFDCDWFPLYMLRKRTLFKETVVLLFARLFVMLLCDIATVSRHLNRDNFQQVRTGEQHTFQQSSIFANLNLLAAKFPNQVDQICSYKTAWKSSLRGRLDLGIWWIWLL